MTKIAFDLAQADKKLPMADNDTPANPHKRDATLDTTDYSSLLAVWGNGDAYKGLFLFQEVTARLVAASAKHPRWQPSALYGFHVIEAEFQEFADAVRFESPYRQHDEALDVIVTALRFVGKEWEI